MLDVNNWLQGHITTGSGTQSLIRSRAMGYPGYYGCQVGEENNHIALFIDPNSVAGGAFSGNVNELMLPNKVIFQQANSGGTDWLNGQSITLENGNVGIGATSPSQKLEVEGSGRFTGSYLEVGYGISTQEAALTIGGVRTASGYAYIDLVGDTTYTDYGLRIIRGNTGANSTSQINHKGTGNLDIVTSNAAAITLLTSSSERMRITSAGNVGIGTTAPLYKLDINETTTNNLIVSRFTHNQSGVASAVQLENRAGAVNSAFDINWGLNSSGNQGTIGVVRTNLPAAGGSEMYFKTSYGEAMRIDGSGDVGIGTNTPKSKLQVAGGIQMADDTDTASADKVGTMRYRESGGVSYADMVMKIQGGYAWVNIVQNIFTTP